MFNQFDIWKFLAGLGIFLFGLHYIEQSLKSIAGRSFKRFLRQQTTNPVKGILSGMLVTSVLQSSSVVSLMVLAFVGAGILTMKSALGIIFGSNLGTTVTGWLVALLGFKVNIESFALPLVAFGGLITIFFLQFEKVYNIGRFLLGFGLLFIGLNWMKESIEFFAQNFDVTQFDGINPYLFFFVGLILTAIIQSSSATMVITLSALSIGALPLMSAAALIVGSDLGTTVTVVLGAVKGTPSKKRVAAGHVLFNVIAGIFALSLLYPLIWFIKEGLTLSDPLLILVCFHSIFNLLGIIILSPLLGVFAKFLEKRFIPDKSATTEFITKVPYNVPEAAIEALRKEGIRFTRMVLQLNYKGLRIKNGLGGPTGMLNIFRRDDYHDVYMEIKQIEGEIVNYYLKIQNEKLEDRESDHLNRVVEAFRSAMHSAKNIKDISHNIKEFESSSNDAKIRFFNFLKEQLSEYYHTVDKYINENVESTRFEDLVSLNKKNQNNYQNFLKEIYNQIKTNELNDTEISTLFNVNREVFNSNKALLMALSQLILNKEESGVFSKLPGWNE